MGLRVAFGVVFFFAALLRARAFAGVEGVLGDFGFAARGREAFREVFRESFVAAISRDWTVLVLSRSSGVLGSEVGKRKGVRRHFEVGCDASM